jgi:ubiquinone/menaquinone biosynthesis C-methylase UbiE
MDHIELTKKEFTRQAQAFATSAATTDRALAGRLVDALGSAAAGKVLDVACGPGIVTEVLAQVAREVVALDLTPEMLTRARDRCARAGLSNVTFQEGSATQLPFGDNTFDAVVTRLSFHHFPDPRSVLSEMVRVVRVGGTVLVADVISSEDREKSALHNAIEITRDPSHVRMLPASEIMSLIRNAGLEVVAEQTWDQRREFDEWARIVGDADRTGPLRIMARALARAGEDAGTGLSLDNGALVFFHRWYLIVARKA